jgi:hypothetical protein
VQPRHLAEFGLNQMNPVAEILARQLMHGTSLLVRRQSQSPCHSPCVESAHKCPTIRPAPVSARKYSAAPARIAAACVDRLASPAYGASVSAPAVRRLLDACLR